jgi:glycosyltransferase involved in cell wall biosynthesis
MKYSFVTPRYGLEVVGGAELGARMLAERLVARKGWSVEVFTTCAVDHMTWANDYPAGSETINGVVVHRIPNSSGRPPEFFPFSERLLSAPSAATIAEAEQFIGLQGPGCPGLTDAVAASRSDLVAFYPYLYTTTVQVMPTVADRALIHPAAHDEPALHLPVFRSTMASAQAFVFQTRSERRLVERLFGVAGRPSIVVGLGFEPPVEGYGDRSPAREASELHGLGERPYVLSLGRVDGFKGSIMLASYFAAYKERRAGPLALVMAGPVTAQPPKHPDVHVLGPVSENEKWALIRGAQALVNPSPHEAFSIVLMEAWSQGVPVVVNAMCDATREHCERSNGGLWFSSYAELEVLLDRLTSSAELRTRLGENGRRYAEREFAWPAIIDSYAAFAERVAGQVR